MTTAEIITEHLGPNWWEDKHDDTVLCALLDRLQEVHGGLWETYDSLCAAVYEQCPHSPLRLRFIQPVAELIGRNRQIPEHL